MELGLLLAGVASATLDLRGFLLPIGFIDGEISGVSLLLAKLFGVPLSVWLIVLNTPFIVLAYSITTSNLLCEPLSPLLSLQPLLQWLPSTSS